ncbi:MAG: SRPBCC family protein [Lewinella sp.]
MPCIQVRTLIAADRKIVFDLARSIDLHKLSTAQTNEEAIAGRTSGLIDLGETVTWRARHFGVYQRLTARVTEFDSPGYFVDEMVAGAFKRFRHEHRFDAVDGATLMTDTFDYTAPLGLLGKLADGLFLQRYMTGLLTQRNAVLKQVAESPRWREILG